MTNFLTFDISEIAGEVQLRTYGRFLEEYGMQLQGIEEALEDSMCDSWDLSLDPVSLQVLYNLDSCF
jgi:WASH complex subunit 7